MKRSQINQAKAFFLLLVSFLILIPARVQSEGDRSISQTLIIKDITLIDGTGSKPQRHSTIVIKNRRIKGIYFKQNIQTPPGSRVINGRGWFLIPGLFDTHAHVTFLRRPKYFSGYDRSTSEQVLKIMLAHGITTIRNPGAPSAPAVALRNDVENKNIIGPKIYTAGELINWGNEKSEVDVRSEIRRQAAYGVDYIKVYSRITPMLLAAAVDEAHKRGLKVIGHLGTTTPTEAVRLGIDGIEHGSTWSISLLPNEKRSRYIRQRKQVGYMLSRLDWLEWIDLDGTEMQEMISTIASSKVPLTPTLIAYATKFMGNESHYRNRPDIQITPKPILETWKNALNNWTEKDFRRGTQLWPKMLKLIKKYFDSGVLLMTGSDLPNPWVIPGVSLHDELELLVKAGIPPLDAIQSATRNSAEGLGILFDVGTVEAGKIANLTVLGHDPIADIKNTRKIKYVILEGEVYTPQMLLAD